MTRETAKLLLPVIKAWSEGKIVQYRPNGESCWADQVLPDPCFTAGMEWRVKPFPREFMIQKPKLAFTTSDVFLKTIGQSTGGSFPHEGGDDYEIIHVREVL